VITQPEALRLADALDVGEISYTGMCKAATELRRLQELNQELLALLKECIHFVEYDPGNVIGKKARAAIAKGEAK
jgi:hypothetical protein